MAIINSSKPSISMDKATLKYEYCGHSIDITFDDAAIFKIHKHLTDLIFDMKIPEVVLGH